MKAKVEKRFVDYACGNVARPAGSVFECTDERFDEINAKLPGYVSKVAAKIAAGAAKKRQAGKARQ